MAHKFEIYKDKAGEFRVRFKYNSEVMFSTEGYSSKSGAKNAIESIKKNAPGAEVDDTTD
ncbi:YegP family protein [Phenylobacterium sp.]|uniref:YegP family protein n=1 Tax=Phenylobacterium sp. TaxID=1871053 RepID=UPI002EDA35D9